MTQLDTAPAAAAPAVSPFRVAFPQAALDDLRRRRRSASRGPPAEAGDLALVAAHILAGSEGRNAVTSTAPRPVPPSATSGTGIRRTTMVEPLSEQLADLSARAKKAEDAVAAARGQAAEMAQKREDEIEADAAQRKARLSQRAADAQDSVASAWSGITTKVQSDVDGLRAKIDYKRYEHDRDKAAKAADDAEENATRAIDFALDAIDNAETAVLDALVARAAADAM